MVIEKKGVDYETYIYRQGRKVNTKRGFFIKTIPKRIKRFKKIFGKVKNDLIPGKVLCLGARTGCEVQAARDVGFPDSIGIDLHPARENDGLVLQGDWHNISFPDQSFENVFTNAIDHCFDLSKLITEILRVLKPGGRLYLMLSKKQSLHTKENKDEYMLKSSNFLFWEDGEDLIEGFKNFGFTLIREWESGSWSFYVLKKEVLNGG
jgi:SAM-dependent methyltransferase